MAEVPIDQRFAVTGSVDQLGEVRAIGGVNEKIEGFFDLCAARGLTGDQGVLIPASNRRCRMLHARVRAAVAAGRFHLRAVRHIDDGLALLTGLEAGARAGGGTFPSDSVHGRVEARLRAFAEARRDYGRAAARAPSGRRPTGTRGEIEPWSRPDPAACW